MTDNNTFEINFETSVGYVINRTAIKTKAYLAKQFKDQGFDITPEQLTVLIGLIHNNGQSQKELGDKILKDKPNMTRLLDILEKRGYIERKPDKIDRRKFKIYITSEGKDILHQLLPTTQNIRKRMTNGIDEKDLEITVKTLNKIGLNIELQ